MPIRINLLAEAQAAEEARRRDPVKLSIWIGSFVVCLVALWIFKLQLDLLFANRTFRAEEKMWENLQKPYYEALTNRATITRMEAKLASLNRLSTNRFLWGTLLDALQQVSVEGVVVKNIKGTQSFRVDPGTPSKTVDGKTKPAIPAFSVAQCSVEIRGCDYAVEEQSYSRYKEQLNQLPYFLTRLGVNEGFTLSGSLGQATSDPQDPARLYVNFTLICHFPEVRRNE